LTKSTKLINELFDNYVSNYLTSYRSPYLTQKSLSFGVHHENLNYGRIARFPCDSTDIWLITEQCYVERGYEIACSLSVRLSVRP